MVEAVAVAANGGDRKSTSFKAMQAMTAAVPIAPRGEKRENQFDNVKLKNNGGNDPDYLAARIKRDRPDIGRCHEGSGAHVEEDHGDWCPEGVAPVMGLFWPDEG